jgi:uncharacterized membrane protein HdeD (DUF308 family)
VETGNKIILVLGILAIAAGIFVFFEASSFLEKATQTEGEVVHVIGTSYKIRYFTNDGTEKIYQGSGKRQGFRVGNSVKVWYRNDNPDKARLTDGKKGARILFIAGIVCILMGVYPLFLKRKDTAVYF